MAEMPYKAMMNMTAKDESKAMRCSMRASAAAEAVRPWVRPRSSPGILLV